MAPPDVVVEDGGWSSLPEGLRPMLCPLLDDQLLWAVDARADVGAGGIVVRLAPAGRYRQTEEATIPWPILEEWETAHPGQLLGRTFWRSRSPRPPELPLRLLPTAHEGPRPLLLTTSPPEHPWGARALEGASGHRLAGAVGMTLPGLLATFETANLLEFEGEPAHAAIRRLDGVLRGRVVVVVGANTADLLGGDEPDLGRFGGTLAGVLPHPSGRSLEWNLPRVAQVARDVLADALVAVRGTAASRVEVGEALREARAGRWAGWQALGDLGVAMHSPTPGHAWRPRRIETERGPDVAWRRRWATGRAEVQPAEQGYVLSVEQHSQTLGMERFTARRIPDLLDAVSAAEEFAACHGLREVAAGKGWP